MKRIALLLFVSVFMVLFFSGGVYALQFQGELDLPHKSLSLTLNTQHQNAFAIKLESQDDHLYHLWVNVSKFKTPFFDISTLVEGELEIKPPGDGKGFAAQGKIRSKYSLVNLKPVEDFSLLFDYQEHKLTVHSLSAGNLTGKGNVRTQAPYDTDLSLDISALPVDDIFSFFAEGEDTTSFNEIYGHIDISGSEPSLRIKGKLSSFEGLIQNVAYDGLFLNFEGTYPFIQITSSTITQPDGMTFKISGNLDLTDLKNLDRQLRSFIKDPMVTHHGNRSEWTLKRINSNNRPGTTELKYLLRKNRHRDVLDDEEAGIFGIERKMKF